MVATADQLILAARDAVVALELEGVPQERILPVQTTIVTEQVAKTLPAIVLARWGREVVRPATNLHDDVTYSVIVVLIDNRPGPIIPEEGDVRQTWRQAIIDYFSQGRISGVAGLLTQTLDPQPVIDLGAWAQNLYVSAVAVQFTVRVLRRAG